MAIPKKYEDLDFVPNDGMVTEAERGLAWRSEFGRGGTEVGIARARDIANKRTLSPDTVKRMRSFFARHEVDKEAEGFRQGEDGYPSNGRIAWALWGGDAGKSWADKLVRQMDRIDESEKTTQKAYVIGVPTNLQTGTLSDVGLSSWERGELIPKIFAWARDDNGDIVPSRARRAFLIVNDDELDVQSGYSFPIAVPNSDGDLIVTEAGINAANSRLGALINNPDDTDIPLTALQRARTRLNGYREQFQESDKGMSVMDTSTVYEQVKSTMDKLDTLHNEASEKGGSLVFGNNEIPVTEINTKDIAKAVASANYGETGTPQKNCNNCGLNNDGMCTKFSFSHGGDGFSCDDYTSTVASGHMEEEEKDKTESTHRSKIELAKSVLYDWVDSVFETLPNFMHGKPKKKTDITPEIVEDTPTESAEDKSIKIFKNKVGRYVFIGRYSNNFRDNDIVQEIITKDAHKDFAKRFNDGLTGDGELWLYHVDSTKIGKASHVIFDDNGEGKGFAMVFGLFDEDKEYIAKALMNSEKSLAMSHGYGRHPVRRDAFDKTLITKYTSHEFSIVSPDDAANKLTTFSIGETKMIENKEAIADALGIEVGHLNTLEAQNGKAAALVGEVIESKTASQPEQVAEVAEQKTESDNSQAELLKALSLTLDKVEALTKQVSELSATIETQNKTIAEIKQPIDAKIAKAANEISGESLSALMSRAEGLNLKASAVGRSETAVDRRTTYGKDKPKVQDASIAKTRYAGSQVHIGLGDEYE